MIDLYRTIKSEKFYKSKIENSSKKSIEESFNKEYHAGLKLQGKVLEVKPTQILIRPEFVTTVIDINANLNLKIEGLSF